MAENAIIWAIVFIAIAIVLFFLEVFVPSGGLIGMFAGLSLVGGIICLFWVNKVLGLLGIIVTLAAIPFLMGFAIKIWPHTPIGRMLILRTPGATDEDIEGQSAATAGMTTAGLVGLTGQALTDMRPVGTCVIDGRRQECLAESGMIRSGAAVKVVSDDGMQIKVRAI